MNTDTLTTTLADVRAERERQDAKWGKQDHHPFVWLGILGEEVGEVNKAVLEGHFHGAGWANYREELIQTAAVAVAMVEYLDRHDGAPASDQIIPQPVVNDQVAEAPHATWSAENINEALLAIEAAELEGPTKFRIHPGRMFDVISIGNGQFPLDFNDPTSEPATRQDPINIYCTCGVCEHGDYLAGECPYFDF